MKTLHRFAEEFIQKRRRGRSARAVGADKCAMDLFVAWVANEGVTYPEDLRIEHVSRWLIHASTRTHYRTGLPRKTLTVWAEKLRVRTFVRMLIARGAVAPSIIDAFPTIRTPALAPQAALKHTEVKRVIRDLPNGSPRQLMLRALVEMAYSTALRPCELLRLNVRDVEAERGLLRVLGKGDKRRLVPLGRKAGRLVENYILAVRPLLLCDPNETALWLSWVGKRLGYAGLIALLHKNVRGKNAEDITWYSFRRACATELARSGASLWAIKEILGHEHLDTLKHYVVFSLDDLKQAHLRCHPRNLPAGGSRNGPLPAAKNL